MRANVKSLIGLLPLLCLGCDPNSIGSGYHDIGTFNSRAEGQKQAINTILKNYNSLPSTGHYKVKYANRNSPPTEERENAIWYSKSELELIFEVDVASGPICRWKEVDKAILDQATKSINSLSKIDSIAKPSQPFSQCR
jgi:hypothetical protein